jgi:hypothetical protein
MSLRPAGSAPFSAVLLQSTERMNEQTKSESLIEKDKGKQ